MGEKRISKLAMNATRQRIIQCIVVKQKASTSEIAEELYDIPQATLYRNIKMLRDSNMIQVVEEKAIRGVVEKYYSANREILPENPTNEEINKIIQGCIFETSKKFNRYFENKDADPNKDKLSFLSTTLVLSDEEMDEFYKEISNLIGRYINKEMTEDRKIRNFNLISVPAKGEK